MFCRTHNSLVLYLNEKSDLKVGGSTRQPVQDMFVFYDHTTEMFAIRGYAFPSGVVVPTEGAANIYAFECVSRKTVKDFIKKVFGGFQYLQVSLVNYDNLPLRAVDITYAWLKNGYRIHREIVGHDYYGQGWGAVVVAEEDRYQFEDVPKMLTMLKDVYRDY